MENNKEWLSVKIKLTKKTKITGTEKRKHDFKMEETDISKRRKTLNLRQENSEEKLAYATQMKLRSTGKITASKLCKEILLTTPTRPDKIMKKIKEQKESSNTPREALSIILNTKMTKSTYEHLYDNAKKKIQIYTHHTREFWQKKKPVTHLILK